MRTKARKDANQKEIVDALRDIPGITVWVLNMPEADICVGWNKKNSLFEIKDGSKKRLTQRQIEFQQQWTGNWYRVNSFDEVLQALGIKKATI